MKKKNIDKLIMNSTSITLKCDCGCNSQVMLQMDNDYPDLQIDCKDDGRSKWHGVYLGKEKKEQVMKFLKGE